MSKYNYDKTQTKDSKVKGLKIMKSTCDFIFFSLVSLVSKSVDPFSSYLLFISTQQPSISGILMCKIIVVCYILYNINFFNKF